MHRTTLTLLIIGLGALSLCAPTSVSDGEVIATPGQGSTIDATEPLPPAAEADPKEADTDDAFMYQWRGRT
ncbi:hypothetical protein F5Y19DRAFT_475149 [Xylariaceae sp. FL1651]|nr:hypothetical protein F5Y19DRAFT_475149 [Xylariaceae sp. FL1651]